MPTLVIVVRRLLISASCLVLASVGFAANAVAQAEPEPGSAAYVQRDTQNMADAYGRITGPGGQLANPAYLPALIQQVGPLAAEQLLAQAADPTRLALTPGQFFPGWNVGNPLRAGWNGTRGRSVRVAFTNKYGALLRGTIYAPRVGARDPYTGALLQGPFPGVVITPGSVQGSEGMYRWIAQDLAERGYVTMTYDTQGQGTSETFPHEDGTALPSCNPFATPQGDEQTGCPGVSSQQLSNFVVGTRNATDLFFATPARPYANPGSAGAKVNSFNPYWRLFDRRNDPRPSTPGRVKKFAIIGHSMGAAAVSKVQGLDKRVAAVVAFDKLIGPGTQDSAFTGTGNVPVVPALAIQAEYGFSVSPWFTSGGSSITPQPSPDGPNPRREITTGFLDWSRAGIDSMVIVPRSSTHLEFTDIPLVLPASRYDQDLSSVYTQLWLDRYLKHRKNTAALLGTKFRYLEPVGNGRWAPVTLDRNAHLSFYYCSAFRVHTPTGLKASRDITGVGC